MFKKTRVTQTIVIVLLVAGALIAACYGYDVYRKVTVVIPNSYAAWATGDLIVEYIRTHDGRWPHDWEDLRVAKESLERQGKPVYYQFDRLPRMIRVDWNADPAKLAKVLQVSNEVPFRVVTKADGSSVFACWGPDTEPNTKIYSYLKGTLK